MAKIRINPIGVISGGSQADAAKQKVASAKNGISDINWQLDGKIKSRNNISGRLNLLVDTLGGIEAKIARINSVSDSNANNYQSTDKRVEVRAQDVAASLLSVSAPGVAGIRNMNFSPATDMIRFGNISRLKSKELVYGGICFVSPAARDVYIKSKSGFLESQNFDLPSQINIAWTAVFKKLGTKIFDDEILKGLPVVGTVLDLWDVGNISYDYFTVAFNGNNSYATGISLSRLSVKAVDVIAGLVPGLGFVSSPVAGVIDDKLSGDLKNYFVHPQ